MRGRRGGGVAVVVSFESFCRLTTLTSSPVAVAMASSLLSSTAFPHVFTFELKILEILAKKVACGVCGVCGVDEKSGAARAKWGSTFQTSGSAATTFWDHFAGAEISKAHHLLW